MTANKPRQGGGKGRVGLKTGRSLFWENARDILLIVGRDGRILDANPTAVSSYGYGLDELLALTVHDLRSPETVPEVDAQMERAAREGILFETIHRRKDGTLFPVEVSSRGVAIGRTKALLSIIRDISKRRKGEEAYRARTELLESIVGVSPLAIVTFDAEGRIGMWNPAAERMFGWKAADVIGKYHPIVPEEKREEFRRIRESALVGKVFSGLELRRKRRDGSDIDISVSTSPVRDASGEVVHFVAVKRDVTGERRMEEELRHAQKMEAVGRLAGGVAHDFNNLLTAITGYSEMLLSRLDAGDPSRREITEIRRAGERAASLTRQLLAFSSKQVLRPKVMDLNSVVSDMKKMLLRLIGEDIELTTSFGSDTAFVRADPGQIEQVLVNLAVNSRDAMPEGGKLILETACIDLDEGYVSRHDPMPPGSYVMLAVTDSGSGMDEETLSRIFEPFFTTKEKGKGTGLGLSTVYGIVKKSGGYNWAYSEPGRGTTFRLYLPRVEWVAEVPEEREPPAPLVEGV